jgi:peptidoglycan/LPS O-acetylase OafA/YrhL
MTRPEFAINTSKPFFAPELDGLRAIAILLVLFHHGWIYTGENSIGTFLTYFFELGWIGVEIFFVLSGFLICTVLLQLKQGAEPFFRTFYLRRIFRIFPLYYLCLAALVVAAIGLQLANQKLPTALQGVDRVWVNALYLTNIGIAFKGWDWAFFKPTWTLALEEQFYILFPFLVLKLSSVKLKQALIAIAVASPILRVIVLATTGSIDLVAMFPLWKFDGFAFGALIAIFVRERTLIPAKVVVALGIASFMASTVFMFISNRFEPIFVALGFSSIYLCVAMLIYSIFRWRPRWSNVLALKPLQKIGQLSYSLYLLHIFTRASIGYVWQGSPTSIYHAFNGLILLLISSIVVAWFSYKYFEQPIRVKGYQWITKTNSERSS